jgi:hypothetical protein
MTQSFPRQLVYRDPGSQALNREALHLLAKVTDRVVCPMRKAVKDLSADFMFQAYGLLRSEPANVGRCGCEADAKSAAEPGHETATATHRELMVGAVSADCRNRLLQKGGLGGGRF